MEPNEQNIHTSPTDSYSNDSSNITSSGNKVPFHVVHHYLVSRDHKKTLPRGRQIRRIDIERVVSRSLARFHEASYSDRYNACISRLLHFILPQRFHKEVQTSTRNVCLCAQIAGIQILQRRRGPVRLDDGQDEVKTHGRAPYILSDSELSSLYIQNFSTCWWIHNAKLSREEI